MKREWWRTGYVLCGSLFGILGMSFVGAVVGQEAKKPTRKEIVVADFEGKDYGNWKVTGTAFGPGPAQGTLPGQMPVSGYLGHGLVNSFYQGDDSTGTLTSPNFTIERKYINFLIGGGKWPGKTCINLLIGGKVVRTATGPNDKPGGSEALDWASWDVVEFEGQSAQIEIIDMAKGGWGHISVDQISMNDEKLAEEIRADVLYNETYRPQFHFTAKKNWLNDPNGLVYYKGEYHLFFQHNPESTSWGNMTWGHAVSRDLVHWQELPYAIQRDALGTIFSGSAVVDWNNTSELGLPGRGSEKPLIAIYTAAGDTSPESKGKPFTQCIAYSIDRGRTWIKYAANPVIQHIIGGNRDPKVVWYAPKKVWVMALYLDGNDYAILTSPNLKTWTQVQKVNLPGCSECPDFFQIPVKGEAEQRKWVFTAANGQYLVGHFDGEKFTPEQPLGRVDYGSNYYAVQTYSDIPPADGRRIQIAWMNGGNYPHMPFNQQMSFPCELTLRWADVGADKSGLVLYRYPVKEIGNLYEPAGKEWQRRNFTLKPGENPLADLDGDLWDIQLEAQLEDASAFGLRLRGEPVVYHVKEQTVTSLGKTAPLKPEGNRVRLRVLLDRTSIEAFGNDGRVSLTSCFVPRQRAKGIEVFAEGGKVKVLSLVAHRLKSAWR